MSEMFTREALILGASGYLLSQVRSQIETAWRAILSQWFCSIEISSRDDLYDAASQWLHSHPSAPRMRDMTAHTRVSDHGRPIAASGDNSIPRNARLIFMQGCGTRLFRENGRWIWVTRTQHSKSSEYRSNESLTFRMLTRDPAELRDLINRIFLNAINLDDDRVSVMALVNSYDWGRVQHRKARPLSSVILPEGVAEGLLADCQRFAENEAWYVARGIPYRRGYLLEGLPGTGKTSLVLAVAGALGKDVYYLSLADPNLTDTQLGNMLREVDDGAVLLLEDIDAMFHGRDKTPESASGVTFSGLLNALDGVAAKEGVLTFLTTNHAEQLDPALIRPGRVDLRLHFTHATPSQAERLYEQLEPEASAEQGRAFARWAMGEPRTMAELQQAAMSGSWLTNTGETS